MTGNPRPDCNLQMIYFRAGTVLYLLTMLSFNFLIVFEQLSDIFFQMHFVRGTNDFVSVRISFKENNWKIGKDLDEKLKTY